MDSVAAHHQVKLFPPGITQRDNRPAIRRRYGNAASAEMDLAFETGACRKIIKQVGAMKRNVWCAVTGGNIFHRQAK